MPFGMLGYDIRAAESPEEADEYIYSQDAATTIFVIEEDKIGSAEKLLDYEKAGIQILLLKGWGRSELAGEKIRTAAIRAVGIDLSKEEK